MIFGESRLKDLYRRVTWGPARRVLENMPAPVEIRIIHALAHAGALALPRRRKQIRENLRLAFPKRSETELNQTAIRTFASHFSNQYISFSFEKCNSRNWHKYIEFEGLEHLKAAVAEGRGVVLMHPHMGPAQLPLHVLGLEGLNMHQIGGGEVTLVQLSETGRWAASTRSRLESRMPVTLHDGKKYLRPVLRALDQGAVVMSACDATGGGKELGRRHTRLVLGREYGIPVGPIWMAWKSGAPLLSIRCVRNRGSGPALFRAIIEPEILLDRKLPRAEVLAHGADLVAQWLERVLHDHAGDWLFWDGFRPNGLLPEEASR